MSRPAVASLLAIVLLGLASPVPAAPPAAVLSDEPCEAPFVLSVPADLIRARGSLAVVLHDDGAGQRLVFSLGPQAVSVTLHAQGNATELARAAAALPPAGGVIILKRLPDGFAVAYGTSNILRGKADLPDGGRWGVVGAPAAVLEQLRLQPTDRIQFSDDFMRTPDEALGWETPSGQWRIAQLESARYSANAFTLVGRATDAQPALTTAGYWFWEDLTVEASVRPSPGAGGFGVGLACQPDGQAVLLRFVNQAAPAGMLQLVRRRAAEETILQEVPAIASPEDWQRLSLSGVAGRLTGALNGVELLAASVPELAHGAIALWVAGPRPVAFDDVEAYSGPREALKPAVLSYEAQAADAGAQAFINDRYMQEWADERDQWLPGAGGVWHAGCYWGDASLSWEIPAGGLRAPAQLHLYVPAGAPVMNPPTEAAAGCHLDLAPAANGQIALTLREGDQTRAQQTVVLPELPAGVVLRRLGDTVAALVGDEVVASFTATTPAAGKIGFTGPAATGQAGRLAITSGHVLDATFRSAPTEWTIGSGEWGVASRWACTPRWSWFQGRSSELASVWTRRRFTGDVVVEFFAGISMDSPWAPFYRHPGNIAVTLCGADGTPGSGYSLVFAGWGNTATGIFRRGELVAQVPGFVMPDIVDSLGGTVGHDAAHKLHNEWRRLRAERSGDTVRLLVDGRVAVSFKDPDPLPGGAVGIWTLEQAITVARARIYYQNGEDVAPPVPVVAPVQAKPPLTLPPLGPPHVASAFEEGLGGWRPATPGSCTVALAPREAPAGGLCLQATNPAAGGRFALAAPFKDLDLRTHPLLAFDYALPAEVRVDLFATVAGQRHRLVLSGPPEPAPGIEDLGPLPAALADGQWHSAQVDLLGLLAPHFAPASPVILQALEFAAYAAPEYLRAGIGGNPAGASWRLDNVYLGGVTAAPVRAVVPAAAALQAPDCLLAHKAVKEGAAWEITPQASGLVTVTATAGATAATDLLAFDLEPPLLECATPLAGATWLGPELSATVRDRGPAGVDEQSLQLQCGDRRFTLKDAALRWQPDAGKLTLDLRAAGVQPPPGQPVTVTVTAADRAGHRAASLQFAFTPDLKADATPSAPPELVGLPSARVDCDFETDLGPLQAWGPDAGVALRRAHGPVAGNPRGGQWCLEARATQLGGLYGVSLGAAPFDASRFPVLEFDYRAPRELRVDLIVAVEGKRRTIKFTDNDETWPVIGSCGASHDDRWRHATVDLQALLARAFGRSAPLVVTDLAFASSGWPGTRENMRWWLDNLRLSAALNVRRLPEGLALASRDESGVAGAAWALDSSAATAPPGAATSADLRAALVPLAGSLAWLHAAALDGAGNRSEPAHLPVRLTASDDTAPPVLAEAAPADGARACPTTIAARVTDAGAGVSPADLRLTINGRTWSLADSALTWDAAAGRATWTLPAGVALGTPGPRVSCRLEATDLTGNVAAPLRWAFTLDPARDTEPPAAPIVSYIPARCADDNGFEQGVGDWGNFLASQILRLSSGGATDPGCLELRHIGTREQGSGFVLVRDFGEGWRQFPLVRFRYRGVQAPYAGIQVYGTTFDGSTDGWTPLGSFTASGGGWQTAELDVAQALARTSPTLDIHRIFLSVTIPPDGALLVDDYAMYSTAATQAGFRWAAPADPSGIAGYSWVLDSAPTTVPPEKPSGTALQTQFKDLKPGRYVFHLRARDGAGHWGPASHVPFELTASATPAAQP